MALIGVSVVLDTALPFTGSFFKLELVIPEEIEMLLVEVADANVVLVILKLVAFTALGIGIKFWSNFGILQKNLVQIILPT